MAVSRNHLGLLLFSLLLHSERAFVAGVPDVLSWGSNITDGNTLVSAGGSFTLGFFSPGVSTNRYLGIWFSVSSAAVCWVANRDRPLNNTAGALVLSSTSGNLVLVDGSGQTIWTSNSSTTRAVPVVAQLLETGNLVIREGTGKTFIWQSFDDLSDTLLPGMKMGKNLWSGTEWYLSSWRSADDPSPTYRLVTEVQGLPDNVLWNGDTRVYRSGPWNGLRFSGTTEAGTYTDMFTFQVNISRWEVTFGYSAKAGAPLSRIVATYAGTVKRLVWEASRQQWETYFQGPRDVCDAYAMCGPFGLCNGNAPSTSFCSCAKGFSPASPSEWSLRETSGGCRRSVALDCSAGDNGSTTTTTDGFLVLQGMKLPDTYNASVDTSITLEDCRARCLANCSCVAYAPADIRVGTGIGCIIWHGDFIDLRYVDGGQDFYLRLPKSELGEAPHGALPAALIIGASIISLLVLLVFLVIVVVRRRRRRGQRISDNSQGASDDADSSSHPDPASTVRLVPTVDLPTITEATENSVAPGVPAGDLPSINEATGNFSESNIVCQGVPPVDLRSIKDATGGFSENNKIGQGGFARVYKAKLPDGTIVAVKRFNQSRLINKGKKCFAREVEVMSKVTHDSVVNLLSYCQEEDEWILVYEYMPNKSLSPYIFGEGTSCRSSLNWAQRLEIIRGVAIGVQYLHDKQIIHRDLKPCNILLDDTMKPKVADFGTAKLFIDDQTNPTLFLTPGYVAPEYARDGHQTLTCDVYSFGVILLETLRGKRISTGQSYLPDVWKSWNEGNMEAILDSQVTRPEPELSSELARFVQIGLLCVQLLPEDRPTMPQVVVMLTNSSSRLARPKKPDQQRIWLWSTQESTGYSS